MTWELLPFLFMEKVKEFDLNFKRNKKVVVYETKTKPFYEDDSSDLRNFGYRFIETIYENGGYAGSYGNGNMKFKLRLRPS